jgi:hypothetical protein
MRFCNSSNMSAESDSSVYDRSEKLASSSYTGFKLLPFRCDYQWDVALRHALEYEDKYWRQRLSLIYDNACLSQAESVMVEEIWSFVRRDCY